jgi:beta-glucanase (GH16 family)
MGSNGILCGACALTVALSLGAPSKAQQRHQVVVNTPVFESFKRHDDTVWWRTHDRAGGKQTNDTGFHRDNIDIDRGVMTLRLTDEQYRGRGNTGASYKSRGLYHYGRYDIVMRAARGSGVISAFYTYTGPVYGDPHAEIDFEFLGRDTTKAQLNFFVDGEPQLGLGVPLGFDAADGFHLYTIIWAPGQIIWQVDGEEIHRVERAFQDLPQHAGKIIADIWAAKDLDKWAGRLNTRALPATAAVRCISFVPAGVEASSCPGFAP